MVRQNPMEMNKFLTSGKNKSEIKSLEENKTVEAARTLEEVKEVINTEIPSEENTPGTILINQKKPIEKRNVTFYLKEENIAKIDKFAGKGKGKTGYNKSELVDILLEQAFSMLKMK